MKHCTTNLVKHFQSQHVQFWVFGLILLLFRFYPFLLGKTLVFGDNYSLMVPGKIFTAHWLKQGILPFWNPHVFSGMPWIADINQSVLYPSTLLFVLFSPVVAFNLLLVIHAFLAYVGMYLLAKRWSQSHLWALLAGALWMFSTQISGSMNNFSTLQSLVWLPWLGYVGLQVTKNFKTKVLFSVVVLLQFLGGYPQHVLYGIAAAVFLSWLRKDTSYKKWFQYWGVTAVLTVSVSAAAWLPFINMLQHSTRMEQTSSQALVGSLQPAMLIKFILPYFFDNPSVGMKWGPAWSGQPNVGIYMTWMGWVAIVTSIFSLFKKRNKEIALFATAVVSTLIFSLGQYLPGFDVVQKNIPLFRIARYPSMIMIITNLILILWVAQAFKNWQLSKKLYKRLSWIGLIIFGSSLVGLSIWYFYFPQFWQQVDSLIHISNSPFHTLARDQVIFGQIVKNLAINSAFFIVSLTLFYRKKLLPLILVLSIEILINTQGLFYFAPASIYDIDSSQAQQISKKIENNRILTRNSNQPYTDYGSYWEAMVVRAPFSDSFVDEKELREFNHVQALRDGMTPNWNMVYGVSTVHGYTTLLPQDYAHLWQTSNQPRINFIDQIKLDNPLLRDWSVGYYLVDTWFAVKEDLSQYRLVADLGRWQLYQLNALPRFRYEDGTAVNFNNFQENPNQIDLVFENNDEHQYLIVADRYDENWRAEVNRKTVKIEDYQGMRKIEIQPGENKIRFYYSPWWFYLGLITSVLTIVIIGLYLF